MYVHVLNSTRGAGGVLLAKGGGTAAGGRAWHADPELRSGGGRAQLEKAPRADPSEDRTEARARHRGAGARQPREFKQICGTAALLVGAPLRDHATWCGDFRTQNSRCCS